MLPGRMAFHCRVAVVQTTHHGTVGSMGGTADVYLMPRVYGQQLPGWCPPTHCWTLPLAEVCRAELSGRHYPC